MANIRVYELAKKLKKDSKELVQELIKEGIEVKSHMSTLDEETTNLIVEIFKAEKKKKAEKKTEKAEKEKKAKKEEKKEVKKEEKKAPSKEKKAENAK